LEALRAARDQARGKRTPRQIEPKPAGVSLAGEQSIAQALAVLRANLVPALFTRFLVQRTARWVDRLAAINRRHAVLHASLELRPGRITAGSVRLFARLALLRVARLAAVGLLRLSQHTLPACRAEAVLARVEHPAMSCLTSLALLRIARAQTIAWRPHAGSHATHAGARAHPRTHSWTHSWTHSGTHPRLCAAHSAHSAHSRPRLGSSLKREEGTGKHENDQ